MSENKTPRVSRRTAMAFGAVSGATALAALGGLVTLDEAQALDSTQALGALKRGVTYLGIDGLDFWPIVASQRLYEDITGVKLSSNGRLFAPLLLPVGSQIVGISAAYQQQPIMEISKRPLFSGTPGTAPVQVFQKSFTISPGGPFASTEPVSPAVVLAADATYMVSAFLTPGSAIFGVRVGYRPPTQSFAPFKGANPRVLDTRTGAKLQAGTDRTVGTGLAGARFAVFNLNVVNEAGAGSIACFAVTGPASTVPSIRYTTNETIQNLVICPLASNGALKLRVTGAATHAFIDLVGFLV